MKQHYLIIPLAVFLTAVGGSHITQQGLAWYSKLTLPSYAPPAQFIGLVWTLIFILFAVSAVLALTSEQNSRARGLLFFLFLLNMLLNVGWSYVFFGLHDLVSATWEAGVLALSIAVLIVVTKPLSKYAALMLAPYLIWVLFATYLTYSIAQLNPYW